MISIKNILIVFHIFIFISTDAQVKNAKIKYQVQLNLKKDSVKEVDQEATRFRQMMLEEVENLQLELIYTDSVSMFHVPTPVFVNKMQERFYKIGKTAAQVNQNFYCNLRTGNYFEHVYFEGEEYLIRADSKFKWTLINEEKSIAGYNCTKAKAIYSYRSRHGKEESLEVTAWYTDQIPLSLGPRNFSGLPGLILELSIANNVIVYYATDVLLNTKKINLIKFPKHAQLIDREAYDKIVRSAYELFFEKN